MLKRVLIFLLVILFLSWLSLLFYNINNDFNLIGEVVVESVEYEKERVFVIKVIDGDTIETEIGPIRLLGINTPEKGKPYYSEAKGFLKQIENKSVEILRDVEDRDRYFRRLRYVFYEGQILNIEILEKGLATTLMFEDLKYKNKLILAEDFAKRVERGLWEGSNNKCADCINLVELDAEEEFFILENVCSFDCDLSDWSVKDDANHFFELDDLQAGEKVRINSKKRIWNNAGDRFFMRDGDGRLAVFYEY